MMYSDMGSGCDIKCRQAVAQLINIPVSSWLAKLWIWTVLKPWAGACDTGWMNMLSHIIFGAGIVIHPNTYCYIQESEKKL